MSNPIVHFEIIGQDGEKTKQFFADLFGWTIASDNPMNYGLVDPGRTTGPDGGPIGIAGGIGAAMGGGEGYVTVYVSVDDVEAALVKAEALGGTRVLGPDTVMPGVTIGLFTEPEGKIIGVLEAPTSDA
jgi:predicted enzyme related to lactoylglutathione lyase